MDRAAFHLDGPFDPDQRLTFFGTELALAGWAILPGSEYRLAVYAGDLLLGCVSPSEPRADLLVAFPWLTAESRPGFNTTVTLPPGLVEADPDMPVRVAVEHHGRVVKESVWRVAKGIPRLEFYIDEAKLLDGKIICDQRNIRLYGWAICQERIEAITADLGENHRVTVQYGIARSDVFAVRPNNPNGPTTGFSLFIPAMPPDCDSILFSILLNGGTKLTCRFELAVRAETVVVANFRRLSFAETRFLSRRAATMSRPCFVILPRETILDANMDGGLAGSVASIRAAGRGLMRPQILIHADCPAAPESAQIFRSGRELSRALEDFPGEWIVCLREGDTVSPGLCLFLHAPEQADRAFVYWDETAVADGRVRTVYKVPGAPFITLLHQNFIGRGWAVRATAELRANLGAFDVGRHMLSLPLAAFQDPSSCAHIPEMLSRHVYEGDARNLNTAEITARNRVLAGLDTAYGPLSFAAGQLVLTCEEAALPRVSVIIPTIGTAGRVLDCLRGLRGLTDYPNLEIIVIDHMPFTPPFLALKRQIRGYADQVLSMIGKFNWSKFNNFGAALATGEALLFLNDDVDMQDAQWLRHESR